MNKKVCQKHRRTLMFIFVLIFGFSLRAGWCADKKSQRAIAERALKDAQIAVLQAQTVLKDVQTEMVELIRREVICIAIQELGKGERGKNNAGKDVKKYMGREGCSWCAGFVGWVLKQAGVGEEYPFLSRAIYNSAKTESFLELQAGDLIVFWRGKTKHGWRGHIGIIEKVEATKIHTIEGNVGKFPAKVRRYTYERGKIPKFLGYLGIEYVGNDIHLVRKAEKR